MFKLVDVSVIRDEDGGASLVVEHLEATRGLGALLELLSAST